MARTFLINYKKANIHTFQDVHPAAAAEKDKHVRLIPGVNELSEENYNAIMGVGRKVKDKDGLDMDQLPHPTFVKFLEDFPPLLEWVPGFSPKDKELKKFSDLTKNEMLSLVSNTLNRELLDKYLKNEKRDEVIKAINIQLEKLKLPEQKKVA